MVWLAELVRAGEIGPRREITYALLICSAPAGDVLVNLSVSTVAAWPAAG